MEKTIRILHIVPNLKAAGVESFIMSVYRGINREKVQFDFIVHNEEKMFFDDEVEKMGGKIYRFSLKDDKNFFKYVKKLNLFFKKHKKDYNIIHCHLQGIAFFPLFVAKLNGISIRIWHSHNNFHEKSVKGYIQGFISKLARRYSTDYFACSEDSAVYLFGKKIAKKAVIIPNAIDLEKNSYKSNLIRQARKDFSLNENDFVLGHVGRFEKQKNHTFLLRILEELVKLEGKTNKRFKLLLIGTGSLEDEVKRQVNKMGLEDRVIMLGVRDDVNYCMHAMDIFVLPSLYEGLGIVLIEAQCSGLYCVASKKVIPQETNVTNNFSFIELNNNPIEWANEINQISNKGYLKMNHFDEISNAGFNIQFLCKKMQNYYLNKQKELMIND